jgi:hypothetical protein
VCSNENRFNKSGFRSVFAQLLVVKIGAGVRSILDKVMRGSQVKSIILNFTLPPIVWSNYFIVFPHTTANTLVGELLLFFESTCFCSGHWSVRKLLLVCVTNFFTGVIE